MLSLLLLFIAIRHYAIINRLPVDYFCRYYEAYTRYYYVKTYATTLAFVIIIHIQLRWLLVVDRGH